jgi:hypothetical protein
MESIGGFAAAPNDNRIQFTLPALQGDFVGER